MLKIPKLPSQENREVAKAKNPRKVEASPLQFLMIKKDQLVLSVAK
jgi:hypothetical protein